jgi:hypothetical protein
MSHGHFGTRNRYAKPGLTHTGNARQAHPNAATADIGLEEIVVTRVTVARITRHPNNSTNVRRAWVRMAASNTVLSYVISDDANFCALQRCSHLPIRNIQQIEAFR